MQMLAGFRPITLEKLKSRAELMQRTDNKYVLDEPALLLFLESLQDSFDVLTIDGTNRFAYSSSYWDTAQLGTYRDHNQGRRKRYKIRFRHYRDNGLYFFEIKIKGFRNTTHKYRLASDAHAYLAGELPASLVDFCNEKLRLHYGRGLDGCLRPSIRVDYQRATLVSRNDVQRITIDSQVRFLAGQREQGLPDNRYIVEVKSVTGRSPADRWLLQNSNRPVRRCSKYSMGVNLLMQAGSNSVFAPVLKRKFDVSVFKNDGN